MRALLLRSRIVCSGLHVSRMPSMQRLAYPQTHFQVQRREFAVIPFMLADIGEGIAECELIQWFVKPGDKIAQFDKVCLVQSDKATVEITSRFDGVVKGLRYDVKQMAKVGEPLLDIEIQGDAPASSSHGSHGSHGASSSSTTSSSTSSPAADKAAGRALASPAVRRIAKEQGIDLSRVQATGPRDRILKEDVLRHVGGPAKAVAPPAVTASPAPRTPSASAAAAAAAAPAPIAYSLEDRVMPVTGLARIMVQTMTAANAVPTFLYSEEIVVDELVKLRKQVRKSAEAQGVKLSYMPFLIKAASLALRSFPQLNAHTNKDCTAVTYKGSHNIGFAMDTPRGLLVPNIKNVQDKSVLEVARELNRLSDLGQAGRLGQAELTGGTFTLSNIGTIGGTYTAPILVLPEVIIGALGKFQVLPRFDSDHKVVATTIMNVSWSADHRVVDGATVARFCNLWKSYLEAPATMVLETK